MQEKEIIPLERIVKSPYFREEAQSNLRRLSLGVSAFSFTIIAALIFHEPLIGMLARSVVFFAASIPFGLAAWYCTQTLPVLKSDLKDPTKCKPLILTLVCMSILGGVAHLLCFIGICLMISHVNMLAAWVFASLSVLLGVLVATLKLVTIFWDNKAVLLSRT